MTIEVATVTPTRIGTGLPFVYPVRLGNETIGYKNLIVPQDEMTFRVSTKHYGDKQSLNGAVMWRHQFETREWPMWSFPVIIRNYYPPEEKTWYDALCADPSQILFFWDHRACGVYTSGSVNGVTFPLSVVVDVDGLSELSVRNHDPFTYNATMKLRLV